MTTRDDLDRASPEFDRLLAAWFDAEARVHEPDDLLDRTLSRTVRMRPRPAWLLPERWLPMELTMRRVRVPRAARYAAVLVALILLAAIALAIVGSQRRVPAPFGVAANGAVAFVTPSGDIAAIDPVTGVTTTIASGPDRHRAPVYSRDGTRVAFVREDPPAGVEVFAVDVPGGTPVRLTNGPMAPIPGLVWSPDGSRIAFVSRDQLWIARTDGSGLNRVDLGDITATVELAWRPPDGRTLLLFGTQEGKNRLFMIKPDGTGLRRVGQFDGGADDGQWLTVSPDGRLAAYGAFPAKQVHIVAIDAGLDQVVAPDDAIGLNFPRFSPDGQRLAVLQVPDPRSDGTSPPTQIGVIPADDPSPHVALTGPLFVGGVQFDWAPDGLSILANQWGSDQTWLLDPAGGPGRQMTWRASFDWVEWQRLAP